jgi:tripartite-type tricarboxylate transporter receptor subunit TctC
MRKPLLAAAFAATLSGLGSATAQVYPSHPITMIVPFPAGGSVDAVGRIVAKRMRVSLGQTVVVENVGGAAGSIGVGRVARAAPLRGPAQCGDALPSAILAHLDHQERGK